MSQMLVGYGVPLNPSRCAEGLLGWPSADETVSLAGRGGRRTSRISPHLLCAYLNLGDWTLLQMIFPSVLWHLYSCNKDWTVFNFNGSVVPGPQIGDDFSLTSGQCLFNVDQTVPCSGSHER